MSPFNAQLHPYILGSGMAWILPSYAESHPMAINSIVIQVLPGAVSYDQRLNSYQP